MELSWSKEGFSHSCLYHTSQASKSFNWKKLGGFISFIHCTGIKFWHYRGSVAHSILVESRISRIPLFIIQPGSVPLYNQALYHYTTWLCTILQTGSVPLYNLALYHYTTWLCTIMQPSSVPLYRKSFRILTEQKEYT